MANLAPIDNFDDVVQLETNTVAQGGAGGIMNAQAQALLNRTFYLKGVYDALAAMIGATEGNGIAPLLNGLIPSQFLPSYVDDILEFANLAAFPATGEQGKIYTALNTDFIYRWTGSTYRAVGVSTDLSNYVTMAALLADKSPVNVTKTANAVFDVADNTGKTIIRMNVATANTYTITSSLTKPLTVRQSGAGITTLVAGSGVTAINGNLVFSGENDTKTIIPVSSGIYDVYGAPA